MNIKDTNPKNENLEEAVDQDHDQDAPNQVEEYDLTEGLDLDVHLPFENDNSEIIKLKEENAQLKDSLLRALAEAENIRKRAERETKDMRVFAISAFAKDLLSVIDNLRRATASVSEDLLNQHEAIQNIMTGVEMTEQELIKVLQKHHVCEIKADGEAFDPQFHEALFEAPNGDVPAGTVINIVESGWTIADRLLRPARVGVSSQNKQQSD